MAPFLEAEWKVELLGDPEAVMYKTKLFSILGFRLRLGVWVKFAK